MGVSYVWSRWQSAEVNPLASVELGGAWITTPDATAYSGYFRTSFFLPSRVKHAWVVVSPDNAFELTVNGNPSGRIYLWRPSRPYQTGLSENGQRLVNPQPALGLNFPREYQWGDHDNSHVPVWLNIATYLKPGRNVFTVEVEARHQGPGFRMGGAIELWSGEIIQIGSNEGWRSEPVPPGTSRLDWTHPHYDDSHWRTALASQSSHSTPLCAFDQRLYQRAFAGNWVSAQNVTTSSAVWFRTEWNSAVPVKKACLRVLANRQFEVFVNGRRLGPVQPNPLNFDGGNWMINDRGSWDDFRLPEIVDPDEIGSLFIGDRFLSPRHADPTYDPVATYQNQINVTTDKPNATNRSDLPGTYDPKRDLADTIRTPTQSDPFPVTVPARGLDRDRTRLGFYGYDVTALLNPGSNIIEARLAESNTVDPPNWPARIAIDGFVTDAKGMEFILQTDSDWKSSASRERPEPLGWEAVRSEGAALTFNSPLPPFIFRGVQGASATSVWQALAVPLLVALTTAVLVGSGWLVIGFRRTEQSAVDAANWVRYWSAVLVLATTVIGTVFILEICFAEREESLWFLQPWPWRCVSVVILLILTFAAGHLIIGSRLQRANSPHSKRRGVRRLRGIAEGRAWNVAVLLVVLMSTLLRAYELDLQPMDDDEYASVQGMLSIAQTGVPGFVAEGVFYSRSPAFHYLTAAFVAVFGQNIWALRLPSIFLGSATVWLTYWVAARLLRNRIVGFAAMVIMALHPFEIFTSHVARFYQQQQFFALLAVYWFCKGFVTEQRQLYRYLTIGAFLFTVLSQELAIIMGPLFAIGVLLFARDLGWKENIRLAVVAVLALGCVFLDWAAFQTLCLSRVEGVSPNFEATIKPHFWQPFNVFSLFIGYSRLHLALTVFFAIDLFLGWKKRSRAFLALFVLLIVGIILTNLLVTHPSLRYQYFLFPLWAILGVESLRRVVYRLVAVVSDRSEPRPRAFAASLACLLLGAVVLSLSPWRIFDSYHLKILPDSTGACRYVASQRRLEDKVMITEPHPHAAFLEIGKADFDLSVPILMDFVMLRKGVLIDRNAGAEAVGSLAQLQHVVQNNDRIWILINKEKFRTRGKNVRWEYPAARIEEFLRQNTELKYRSPFWYVYLWDVSAGHYRHFGGE